MGQLGVVFLRVLRARALTFWAANAKHAVRWLLLIAVAVVMALLLDYRSRIAVALVVALALGLASRYGFLARWPKSSLFAYLGQISYSVFLIHFPICLIVNGLFARVAMADPWLNLAGMVVAWAASLLAGGLFYRFIEGPAQQGFRGLRAAPGLT
jgi:peptidoglycan/LPS O-acetylase OafA/YrhL